MSAFLHGISSVLPERFQSNQELTAQIEGWNHEKIVQKTGIVGRRVAADGETAGDLCERAANVLLDQYPEWRSQIDALIVCTQSPDYFLPSTACLLQDRLGLSTRCAAFDLTLACSGYTYALWLARSLILSQSATRVLLLAGDTFTRYCNPQEPATASLFGDGATATLLSGDREGAWAEVGVSALGTDGRGANHLILRAGAARLPQAANNTDRYLYMNGAEVASFAVSTVKSVLSDLFAKTGLDWPDIDHFVFHQANPAFVKRLAAAYRLPLDKVPVALADVGNTCSATIPMAMVQSMQQQRFSPNQNLVLVGFGVGFSWAATAVKWLAPADTRPIT